MNLRQFGPAWDAAGLRGFAGEGYWYHQYFPVWLSFNGSTLVTKTITSYEHPGNMELEEDYRPRDAFPKCIWFNLWRGLTLNSVGLSGPGIEAMVAFYALIEDPFMISWMPIGTSLERQVQEAQEFEYHVRQARRNFLQKNFGIQLNVSCPNVGADMSTILEKTNVLLSILERLRVPIVVKLNLLTTPETAAEIAKHPACSGICITNTAPFGTVLPQEFWDKHFPNGSPLLLRNPQFGKGGLSGPDLFPHVTRWIREFRLLDKKTHVNAGGGIWRASDVNELRMAGANSIFIGTVAMLRPWRVPSIIRRARKIFGP